jgi:branched-chain amino acid transport system substrate-binding protein
MTARIRRGLNILVIIAAIAVAFGCRQSADRPRDAATQGVQIGVITVLSGEAAAYGTYTRNGLELALQEIGVAPVRLVYKDSKADPQEAIRVFRELQAAGVPVVIGPFTSTEARQVGPEAQRTGTVMITTSATADDLSSVGDRVFMMLPPNSKQGVDQARFAAQRLQAKRAAILYRQNPYGQTLKTSFADTFRSLGGEIVAEESFPDGSEEFRDRLRVLARTTPDVVFVPAHDADTGRILRQAREIKFPPTKFLGGDGSMTPTMIQLAGAAAEGSIYSNVASTDDRFAEAYRAKFQSDASPYAASAYDTLKVLADLASKGARSSDDFQRGLTSVNMNGATGPTKFTKRENSFWCLDKEYRQFEVASGDFRLLR